MRLVQRLDLAVLGQDAALPQGLQDVRRILSVAIHANENAECAAGRQEIEDGALRRPFPRYVGKSVLTRGEGEAQELQLDEPKVGSDLFRLAESALNDVGRGVRGLDDICGAEHEQCGQERSRAHEPPPTGWIGTARL